MTDPTATFSAFAASIAAVLAGVDLYLSGRAHDEQTETLTKMRLLTTPPVVEAAMGLHVAGHAYVDFVESAPEPEPEAQRVAGEEVWRARRTQDRSLIGHAHPSVAARWRGRPAGPQSGQSSVRVS
ncbi:hypothetical protein Aau02nite_66660 [Amorphoplanes auranticolor]|uniref:Uncharacterized protein n=1 Tax=Actinoplanes auranticolor TaxID=47988 RepID=A0A919SPL6_9ACTN|nr:hypothetical protein Aau02nite_66660 [Actinoplanes auranticolor]